MKYISVDIETTSLDPKYGNVIQFGAIIEDSKNLLSYEDCPKFEVLVEHSIYIGQPFPLAMHQKIFQELAKQPKDRTCEVVAVDDLAERFALWLVLNGLAKNTDKPINIIVAGKNFSSFDWRFLRRVAYWEKYIQISHRILDPSILYWDPIKDSRVPNMEECKKRAEFESTIVVHTALADAWDVIELLRKKY